MSVPCRFLNEATNEVFHSLLEPNSYAKCAAVVQFYRFSEQVSWTKHCCGIVVIEIDYRAKSFFLRIYDMSALKKVLDQELFLEMKFVPLTKAFHCIQTDGGPIGLAFADIDDADSFTYEFERRISKRKQAVQSARQNLHNARPTVVPSVPTVVEISQPTFSRSIFSKKNNKGKKNLSRNDISSPANFKHLNHVGFDKESSQFSLNSEDNETVSTLLSAFGVDPSSATTQQREIFSKLVTEKYGFDAVRTKLASRPSRPPPMNTANRGALRAPRQPPPPPPSQLPHLSKPSMAPPPVPIGAVMPTSGPPPPPPPPPPPAPNMPIPVVPSSHPPVAAPTAEPAHASPIDLQAQIAGFNKGRLKKVTDAEREAEASPKQGSDLISDLSGLLDEMMGQRRAHMCHSDSSDSESWESD